MKLLIDIDENDYNDIVEQVEKRDYPDMFTGRAIANGTVLPEGHGDLIDRSALQDQIHSSRYSDEFCIEHNIDRSINLNIVDMAICNAPAIVTVDKENKE